MQSFLFSSFLLAVLLSVLFFPLSLSLNRHQRHNIYYVNEVSYETNRKKFRHRFLYIREQTYFTAHFHTLLLNILLNIEIFGPPQKYETVNGTLLSASFTKIRSKQKMLSCPQHLFLCSSAHNSEANRRM